jgi:hypothetical protein
MTMDFFRRTIIFFILIIPLSYGKYEWTPKEDPGNIVANYEAEFKKLPTSGEIMRKPWSGDYWATYKGGISYRWNSRTEQVKYELLNQRTLTEQQIKFLSPAEKFDLLKGDEDWSITKMERERTRVLEKDDIPTWFGLCHAWAPATLIYESPDMANVIGPKGRKIPFYASDIKALLTYNLHLLRRDFKTYFMGSRCDVTLPKFLKFLSRGRISEDKYLNLVRGEGCDDMNPGAVHLALTNLIGLKKMGFIMDKTRGGEVWNHPIYGFKTIIEKTSDKKKLTWRGIKIVGKKHKIRTTVMWTTEIKNLHRKSPPNAGARTMTYQYTLTEDSDGDIIGGKWNQDERPDFFWRISNPGFHDLLHGLKGIYHKSIALPPPIRKKRSPKELYKLFKETALKVKHSRRFLRNSLRLVKARKQLRKKYYKNLKDWYLNNYKQVLERLRR